jgi:hypothetical protein
MTDARENINFIRKFTNAAAISDGARWQVAIESTKTQYGLNFNTLMLVNHHTVKGVWIEIDGNTNAAIPAPHNGGTINISQEDNFRFNEITIYNNSGAEIAIGDIHLSVGRMGRP